MLLPRFALVTRDVADGERGVTMNLRSAVP